MKSFLRLFVSVLMLLVTFWICLCVTNMLSPNHHHSYLHRPHFVSNHGCAMTMQDAAMLMSLINNAGR